MVLVYRGTGTTQVQKRSKKRNLFNGRSRNLQQIQRKALVCNQGVGGSNPSAGTNHFNELRYLYKCAVWCFVPCSGCPSV